MEATAQAIFMISLTTMSMAAVLALFKKRMLDNRGIEAWHKLMKIIILLFYISAITGIVSVIFYMTGQLKITYICLTNCESSGF